MHLNVRLLLLLACTLLGAQTPHLAETPAVVGLIDQIYSVSGNRIYLMQGVLYFPGSTPNHNYQQLNFRVDEMDLTKSTFAFANSKLHLFCKPNITCVWRNTFEGPANNLGKMSQQEKFGALDLNAKTAEIANQVLQDLAKLQSLVMFPGATPPRPSQPPPAPPQSTASEPTVDEGTLQTQAKSALAQESEMQDILKLSGIQPDYTTNACPPRNPPMRTCMTLPSVWNGVAIGLAANQKMIQLYGDLDLELYVKVDACHGNFREETDPPFGTRDQCPLLEAEFNELRKIEPSGSIGQFQLEERRRSDATLQEMYNKWRSGKPGWASQAFTGLQEQLLHLSCRLTVPIDNIYDCERAALPKSTQWLKETVDSWTSCLAYYHQDQTKQPEYDRCMIQTNLFAQLCTKVKGQTCIPIPNNIDIQELTHKPVVPTAAEMWWKILTAHSWISDVQEATRNGPPRTLTVKMFFYDERGKMATIRGSWPIYHETETFRSGDDIMTTVTNSDGEAVVFDDCRITAGCDERAKDHYIEARLNKDGTLDATLHLSPPNETVITFHLSPSALQQK